MPLHHKEEVRRRLDAAAGFLDAVRADYEEIREGRVVSALEAGDDFFSAHEATLRHLYDPSVRVILAPVFFLPKWSGRAGDESVGAVGGALIKRKKGGLRLMDFRATTRIHSATRRELDDEGNLIREKNLNSAYLDELALRVFIARSMGLPITAAGIVHWGAYRVYREAGQDPRALLEFTKNLIDEVDERQGEIPLMLQAILEESRLPPEDEEEEVMEDRSKLDVSRLYRMGEDLRRKLEDRRITDLREIPDEMLEDLSPIQRRQIQALREGRVVLQEAEGLRGALERIAAAARTPGARLSLLDFETVTPVVARIVGTSNEQTVTLQFSNHFYEEGGNLCHFQYLYDGDPLAPDAALRLFRETAAMILEAVGPAGPILVYSESFEKSRLRDLARRLRQGGERELAERIDQLTIDARVMEVVRRLRAEERDEEAGRLETIVGFEPLIGKYIEFLKRPASGGLAPEEESFRRGLAEELETIVTNDRIIDLLPLVRNHIYHADFDASFSLKKVLKVLCPGRGYDDLEEISNGELATIALEEMLLPSTASERRDEIRRNLLAYCRRDTMAEVWILEKLFEAAGLEWSFGQTV